MFEDRLASWLDWLPDSLCLDDEYDKERLAAALAYELDPQHLPAFEDCEELGRSLSEKEVPF